VDSWSGLDVLEKRRISCSWQDSNPRSSSAVVPKVGGTAPWGAVVLPRWALIGTRGGRERCYYHRGALVDK
jgi:hypothetical protein